MRSIIFLVALIGCTSAPRAIEPQESDTPPSEVTPVVATADASDSEAEERPDLVRSFTATVSDVYSMHGVACSMRHDQAATWIFRAFNVFNKPITIRFEASTFRTERGSTMGVLIRKDSDGDTSVKPGNAREFLVEPELLAGLRNDGRMWAVMQDGEFEVSISTPDGDVVWKGKLHDYQNHYADEWRLESKLTGREVAPMPGRSSPTTSTNNPSPGRSAPSTPTTYTPSSPPASNVGGCVRGCRCGNSCIDCSKTCHGGSTYRRRRR